MSDAWDVDAWRMECALELAGFWASILANNLSLSIVYLENAAYVLPKCSKVGEPRTAQSMHPLRDFDDPVSSALGDFASIFEMANRY
jgi:hypothetical protein